MRPSPIVICNTNDREHVGLTNPLVARRRVRIAGSNATPGKEILSEIVRTLTKSNAEDISTNVRLLD